MTAKETPEAPPPGYTREVSGPDLILGTAEVCELLGCKPRTLSDLIRSGMLRGQNPGHGGWRILRSEVMEYLRSNYEPKEADMAELTDQEKRWLEAYDELVKVDLATKADDAQAIRLRRRAIFLKHDVELRTSPEKEAK